MKIKVRRGVFETNSSSTHSLQIDNISVEQATENVYNRIRKAYEDSYGDDNYFDPEDFIDKENCTVTLNGFETESGDEQANVYYIITNWMGKIQYIAMLINNFSYYLEGYDYETYKNSHYYENLTYLITNTEAYKTFEKHVKKYMASKGYDIKHVVFDIKNDTYFESLSIDNVADNIFNKSDRKTPITADDITTLFWTIMNDSYVITFADEAYRPYYKPQIHII